MNVYGVLDYLDHFTEPGDYIVVEDTSPFVPTMSGVCVLDDIEYVTWGEEKLKSMEKFLEQHPNHYRVDKHYTDFFG